MAHEAGTRLQAKIVKTIPREMGGKDVIDVRCELPSGEVVSSLIFMTFKSAGIARARLKSCGFDVDTQSLGALVSDERLLSGNFVDLEAELYNGKLQWNIQTAKPIAATKVASIDQMLRGAKEGGAVSVDAAPAGVVDDDIPF